MPLVINTNIGSLNAQRNLVKSGLEMSTAMERLSSGLRINTAADDAAGLALTNRFTSQIRGLDQAVRNANDGISMISTAEGALQEATNILQRMRELAIQSSNGIYSDADRSTLNAEVQQLKSELDRISETTSFNGQRLLDGSQSNISLQVGADAYQSVDFSIESFSTNSLGGTIGDLTGTATAGLTALQTIDSSALATSLIVNGVTISDINAASITTVEAGLEIMNNDLSSVGVNVSALTTVEGSSAGSGVLGDGQSLVLAVTNNDSASAINYTITGTSSMSDLVSAINQQTPLSASVNSEGKLVLAGDGVTSIGVSGTGAAVATGIAATTYNFSLVFTSENNEQIQVQAGTGAAATFMSNLGLNTVGSNGILTGVATTASSTAFDRGDLLINGVEIGGIASGTDANQAIATINAINAVQDQTGVTAFLTGTAQVSLVSSNGENISIETANGKTSANLQNLTGLRVQNADTGLGDVSRIDVSTLGGAQSAVSSLATALDQVNAQRADLGAITNRLNYTVSNLMNVSENISASRSRILDADFAQETANLSRTQVLQQATSAMLAQANAAPQLVLSLLR